MNKKLLYLVALGGLLSVGAYAQVTIGSGDKPAEGALLDLKEFDDATAKAGGRNAEKGLGLPRVKLTNLKPTTGAELAASIGNTTDNYDMNGLEGLIVYNVKPDEDVCKPADEQIGVGIYIWEGSQWLGIGITNDDSLSPEVYKVTDSRDSQVYLARNFGTIAGDWMLENMRYVPSASEGFTHTAANSNTDKYYAYPEGNDSAYDPNNYPSPAWESKKGNGLLYNWTAATNNENSSNDNQAEGELLVGPTTAIQGICPPSWHLPSDEEWNDLEREIYTSAHLYSTYTEAEKNTWTIWDPAWETTTLYWRPSASVPHSQGSAMKYPCPPVGSSNAINGKSRSKEQGGFSAVMGSAGTHNTIMSYGETGHWWTSSSNTGGKGWSREIRATVASVSRASFSRGYLYSVRCKKN